MMCIMKKIERVCCWLCGGYLPTGVAFYEDNQGELRTARTALASMLVSDMHGSFVMLDVV